MNFNRVEFELKEFVTNFEDQYIYILLFGLIKKEWNQMKYIFISFHHFLYSPIKVE